MKHEEIYSFIIREFPDFSLEDDYDDDDLSFRELSYIVASYFDLYLVEKYINREMETLKRGFQLIEKLHLSDDATMRELATVGFLEDMMHTELAESDEFLDLLGTESKKWWFRVQEFWDGNMGALLDDNVGRYMNLSDFKWTREPDGYTIGDNTVEMITKPHTDLWQRTYYHFQNDNAPVLQIQTEEKYFSFIVRTEFIDSHQRFDQCGIVMYLDSENWLKGSVEYENSEYQHLGSVVTNHGYSDWATTTIDASIKHMWYRFSRRADDYCIECSSDGIVFQQMRICHMFNGNGKISFGIYACSPENSSFKAVFSHIQVTECQWLPHVGQQPDECVSDNN